LNEKATRQEMPTQSCESSNGEFLATHRPENYLGIAEPGSQKLQAASQELSFPAQIYYSHSIVPGGLDVMS
jgi:hypothetical protein